MAAKKAMIHRGRFLKIYSLKFCDIWQNFYFYPILNNENFKLEVKKTNFVTHLIITVQLYYWSSKNSSVKILSNKFQMVTINYSKLCASLQENLMSEFYVNWSEVKFKGCIQSYMLPWKLRKRQILPVNKISLAKFQPFSCHDLANDIYSQTSKTVFSHLKRLPLRVIIRTLRSNDADGNENVKEQ